MNNSIVIIHPYKRQGFWVFDDESTGLVKEGLISGTDIIIDKMVENMTNPEDGFSIIFSNAPFPGFQLELIWDRSEHDGNWYYSKKLNMEGWLCAALLKYFNPAPKKLYTQFKEKR